ncbi:hypothetical protein [Oceanispirochaeta sp.]|jgi:hypothetical protein|uniref:IS66 family insertion sequence element accessory protein TnpA n=1 Tax=Oceanispirochaeta sp. TaxID=2035350 RepID=UPI0026114981|nr:hypothetical protein [Oceanispirochaeta sp.]MDA3957761.1 hypothetical protein [Oceanispirochaeta sp.]
MKRRTAEDWDTIIQDYMKSGLSQKEYCQKYHLNYYTLRDQRIKRERSVPTKKLIRITPEKSIPIMVPVDSSVSKIIKITLPTGMILEIPADMNPKTIQFFITTLWNLM